MHSIVGADLEIRREQGLVPGYVVVGAGGVQLLAEERLEDRLRHNPVAHAQVTISVELSVELSVKMSVELSTPPECGQPPRPSTPPYTACEQRWVGGRWHARVEQEHEGEGDVQRAREQILPRVLLLARRARHVSGTATQLARRNG
jgi:hypothetical protein